MPIEFGLYDVESIGSLEINWPNGLVETYTDISANQYIYAIEGDSLYCGISDGSLSVASGRLWLNCSPNPFEGVLIVDYSGAPGVTAELAVFDLSGRLVRSLGSSALDGSLQNTVWGGSDDAGECVPSGVYICRLLAPFEVVMRKVTLLR